MMANQALRRTNRISGAKHLLEPRQQLTVDMGLAMDDVANLRCGNRTIDTGFVVRRESLPGLKAIVVALRRNSAIPEQEEHREMSLQSGTCFQSPKRDAKYPAPMCFYCRAVPLHHL